MGRDRYELIQEVTSEGFWDWDLITNRLYLSPRYCDLAGYAPEETIFDSNFFKMIIHPDDLEQVINTMGEHVQGKSDLSVVAYRMISKNGDVRWIKGKQKIVEFDEQGSPTRLAGTIFDITDRKEVEIALSTSNERLNLALTASKMGVWDLDLLSNTIQWSPEVHDIVGLNDFNGTFEAFSELLHPEDAENTIATVAKALKQKETYTDEFRIIRPDGELRWLFNLACPTYDKNGTPVRLTGTVHDTTERKQVEKNLSEMLTLLKNVTNRVPGVVYQFRLRPDGTYCFPFANENLRELFQVDPEEVREDASKVFAHIHPDDYGSVVANIKKSAIELTPWRQEFRIIRDDGTERWVFGDSLPQRDEDGSILWNGFTTDITERRNNEEILRKSKIAAEAANIAKSQFLANMSHEIRTPLNGVLGMAQLLELTNLTDEQLIYVDALKQSSKSLNYLISDILDLSKLESGKTNIELSEFSLVQCINNVSSMHKAAVYEKQLSLDMDYSQDIPKRLLGDNLRVKQVLLNLIGNAVKFTALGGVTVSTKLLEQYDNSVLVQIKVHDTGIGISQAALEQIFLPFTQVDGTATRKYGGAGLGLSISHRIVELMGGNISVESTLGVGSCFTVTLPFGIVSDTPLSTMGVNDSTIQWEGPSVRILFVEDYQINITYGTSLLNKLGLKFITAENGKDCLAALEQATFDIVLMDIQMPIMNGEEALYEIRKKELETGIHLPVIAMTAYSMRGDKEHFMDVGFDGYVSKPFAINDFVHEIKRVMSLARLIISDTP